MSSTMEAETSSPKAEPLPQELIYTVIENNGPGVLYFRNPVTPDHAKAIAFDFAALAAEHTSLDHLVVDASNDGGVKLHIFSGLDEPAHSYTITAGASSETAGAQGEICLAAEPEAGNAKIIGRYMPKKGMEALLINARSYETWGGFVEKMPSLREKLYHKGVALAQFAAAGASFAAIMKAFPEEDAPLWIGFAWAAGWMYALFDGIYRIAHNVPVWKSGEIEKKERKRKSLAHAFSHKGASED